jgi:hypothetical protein
MTLALLILGLASVLRIVLFFREGNRWSAADETVMARLGLAAAVPGYSYRDACYAWLEHENSAKWPGIVRYGNIFLLGALYRLTKSNTYYVPSAVSTAAGIGSLWVGWLIAQAVGIDPTVAALLLAASPLQLHLGRRALQDSLVCCLTLLALWMGLAGWVPIAFLALAALVAVKETAALHMLAVGSAWVVAGVPWTHALACIAAGSLLYFWVFWAISGEALLLWKLAKRLTQARHDSYGKDEQQGHWHRLPIDLALLAPLPVALAIRSELSAVTAFLVALLVVQSLIPILRSVRMVTAADTAIRLLAATVAPLPLAALILILDLVLFVRVFQKGEVYDPVTSNLVSALGFAPKRA